MSEKTDSKSKVFDILKGFSTAMVVTHGLDGGHGARPMHVANVDEANGAVSFLAGDGALTNEIQKESAALLVFQDSSAYLSLRGHARVEHDAGKTERLWKEPYKVWFPKGAQDPDIRIIVVKLLDAEYWDNRGTNKLQYLFEAAKAYMKGVKPEVDVDQHAKMAL
jgi:general stress protein 26